MSEPREPKSLGEYLRDARLKKELSLREVALKIDVAPSYLSDIENDRRVPSEAVLRELAQVLDLDFDYLMALAGRFGNRAERYLRRHPAAGMLFRSISDANLEDRDLQRLLKQAEELKKKKGSRP